MSMPLPHSTEAVLIQAAVAHLTRLYGPAYRPQSVWIELPTGQWLSIPIPALLPLPAPPAAGPPPAPRAAPRHSPDFRSVCWCGAEYTFTTSQALVIERLWRAWEAGTPEVSQAELIEAAESDGDRIRDLFRGHPAWGALIVPGARRGTLRLADPDA